ncbi:MAG TPA: tRNA epoxyqueuosine(34) reductase QueG [Gemmatimonadaceae bacterium]|nr:tRNA epoxyqueuosine(34) reductase QueG [Gemmatimonadaceae bacterium]
MLSSALIKAQALGLGFDLVGLTKLGEVESFPHFEEWLNRDYAGDMTYLERGKEKRRDTTLPFPGAKSAIVVAMNYDGSQPSGPIARYARGDDYHDIMTSKLDSLREWIESQIGEPVRGKSYVDTGPILERDLARKAGLGWIGKNTNLLNPQIGSFFFIGSLLVDLELDADTPFESDHCGTCTRCIEACPTQAITEPRVLDATKCISYLTIESRSEIPDDLRSSVGELLYGCDICQDVCPWNIRFSKELTEPALAPRTEFTSRNSRDLALEIIEMDDEKFRERFRASPMKRAKLSGLQRNARVVLENAVADG